MALLGLKSPLSAGERIQRRRIILSDTLALLSLFLITALLAVSTNYLYQSYASHQEELARRWLARGEEALRNGNPRTAIDALHSALAYAPEQRDIQIALAEALASAGRIQEATAYFNTLLESQPGDGMINLQLARLAARQGNVTQALEDYQRSIYGSWEGNGYIRRREVRRELIDFLIASHLYDLARSELLVASGNAPEEDTPFQLELAQLMESAQDPADALHLYRTVLRHHPSQQQTLEGAGRAAFQLGRYLAAKQYLERALNISRGGAEFDQPYRQMLRDSTRLLLLYPSPQLKPRDRAARILVDRKLARTRLAGCVATADSAETAASPKSAAPAPSTPGRPSIAGSLSSLASRFTHPRANAAVRPPPPPPDPLPALATQWQQEPDQMTMSALVNDPQLAQSEVQLIEDTEKITRQVCGEPTGDDALLLKIAEAPNAVEQE